MTLKEFFKEYSCDYVEFLDNGEVKVINPVKKQEGSVDPD